MNDTGSWLFKPDIAQRTIEDVLRRDPDGTDPGEEVLEYGWRMDNGAKTTFEVAQSERFNELILSWYVPLWLLDPSEQIIVDDIGDTHPPEEVKPEMDLTDEEHDNPTTVRELGEPVEGVEDDYREILPEIDVLADNFNDDVITAFMYENPDDTYTFSFLTTVDITGGEMPFETEEL
jgi:hypothetical protein